jgi:ElaB/YqjD/DUF883 family membrane-anchored ribosome-binding protein
MGNKKLVKEWGENTAYTAKGHFKSADIKKKKIYILLSVNIIFAIISVTDCNFNICPLAIKIIGVISLIASILLLIDESQEGNNSFRMHKNIGEEYLSLHEDLHRLFRKGSISDAEIESIREQYRSLQKKDQPMISRCAYKKAKKAIEKADSEMTVWWKEEETN